MAPTCAPNLPKSPIHNDATSTAAEFEESYSYDSDERLKATTTTIRNSAMAADSLTVKRSHTYDSRGRPEWSRLVARVVVGAGGRPVGVNRVMWDDRGAVGFEAATGFPVGGSSITIRQITPWVDSAISFATKN